MVPLAVGILLGLTAIAVGVVLARRTLRQTREAARRLLADSRRDADNKAREIVLSAEERTLAMSDEADKRERELEEREAALEGGTRELEREASRLLRHEKDLRRREGGLERMEQSRREADETAQKHLEQARADLERIAGLTADEARAELIAEAEDSARREAAKLARKIEDESRERAERDALDLVVRATQRINVRKAVETTVSFIELPSDEMKGRIIGREGRNIRALETATGIDLIVDDTPRSIVISSFDPVRREIARVAIERLIEDGRIHPARIEEVVERVATEIDSLIEETGTQAAFELGLSDLHPRLNRLVGRTKYHTLHGQNLLQHCKEVALIAGYMTAELGGQVDVARRAGLLHEVGGVEEGVADPSMQVSADLAAKYGESEDVVRAIRGLHDESDAKSVEALLLKTADRVSSARPGARKDNLEVFIERLKRLEKIAVSFKGVERAFAVKAGKELRVVVDAKSIDDRQAHSLSRKVARALERDLSFPGKIKISVVRETRAVHFAL
jgi:ribonuclease Y